MMRKFNSKFLISLNISLIGKPPKSTRATVKIITENVNDEKPDFTQQVYTPNCDENAEPNSYVTKVSAPDIDRDQVKYAFSDGSTESGPFVIDEMTGIIRTGPGPYVLDEDKYELFITTVDDGSCCQTDTSNRTSVKNSQHNATSIVVVFITDINDNKPVFNNCSESLLSVDKDAPVGQIISGGNISANDEEKGVNGQVCVLFI